MFADVYVGYPLEESYTYKVPESLTVKPGMRVKVNFAGRKTTAYVFKIHNDEPQEFKVKEILEVYDDEPIFDDRLVDTARFISASYLSTPGETMALALPSGKKPSSRYKVPFKFDGELKFTLSEEQSEIYDAILRGYGSKRNQHLLFGVTGSGKTEIYMKLAQYCIEQNKSVIYLVPEITISSQIFERLHAVFGEKLIIYHSHLTPNQRLYNWKRFYSGEAAIAVGTRSAVFLQCKNLGMIIIDEEHDGSYKEQSSPRYGAKRVAFYRSQKEDALLLLGSATPSVETLFNAEKGVIDLHRLEKRFGNAALPEIETVKVNISKPKDIISPILMLHTKRAVDEGKQAIFLLNRRGFAPYLICDSCRTVVSCPHCDVSMNYHREGYLLCHYCGYKRDVPDNCGECGSEEMIKLGAGTQRLEDIIQDTFHDFRVYRMDQDSMRKRGEVYKLVEQMDNGEIDILLGTQMVAKGFDFHKVTVVGVLMADIGLNIPDFRASEKIFSLIMQVSGRSGRGDSAGLVIVQTLEETHAIFKFIKDHDYYGFYREELETRKVLGYPPFKRMIRLLVRGQEKGVVIETIEKLKDELVKRIREVDPSIVLMGPAAAPLSKIGGNFRHHIILKAANIDQCRKVVALARTGLAPNNTYLEIDVDPQDIM